MFHVLKGLFGLFAALGGGLLLVVKLGLVEGGPLVKGVEWVTTHFHVTYVADPAPAAPASNAPPASSTPDTSVTQADIPQKAMPAPSAPARSGDAATARISPSAAPAQLSASARTLAASPLPGAASRDGCVSAPPGAPFALRVGEALCSADGTRRARVIAASQGRVRFLFEGRELSCDASVDCSFDWPGAPTFRPLDLRPEASDAVRLVIR